MIRLASAELTMSQEVVPEWQTAASALLSTLGMRHAQLVMKELLTKFQPGGNPHFFVVNTLGQLAVSNGEQLLLCSVVSRSNYTPCRVSLSGIYLQLCSHDLCGAHDVSLFVEITE